MGAVLHDLRSLLQSVPTGGRRRKHLLFLFRSGLQFRDLGVARLRLVRAEIALVPSLPV